MLIDHSILSGLTPICQKHKVNELYLFGSMATGHSDEESDVDLLVKFGEINLFDYFDNYVGLKTKLEALFNKPVDLVEDQAIRNPIFRKVVDREKKLLYGRKDR